MELRRFIAIMELSKKNSAIDSRGSTSNNIGESLFQTPRLGVSLQALVHHLVGRQYRRKLESPYPEEIAQVLHWFGDQPSEQRPFSIHNLCTTGQPHGCEPVQSSCLQCL